MYQKYNKLYYQVEYFTRRNVRKGVSIYCAIIHGTGKVTEILCFKIRIVRIIRISKMTKLRWRLRFWQNYVSKAMLFYYRQINRYLFWISLESEIRRNK